MTTANTNNEMSPNERDAFYAGILVSASSLITCIVAAYFVMSWSA